MAKRLSRKKPFPVVVVHVVERVQPREEGHVRLEPKKLLVAAARRGRPTKGFDDEPLLLVEDEVPTQVVEHDGRRRMVMVVETVPQDLQRLAVKGSRSAFAFPVIAEFGRAECQHGRVVHARDNLKRDVVTDQTELLEFQHDPLHRVGRPDDDVKPKLDVQIRHKLLGIRPEQLLRDTFVRYVGSGLCNRALGSGPE